MPGPLSPQVQQQKGFAAIVEDTASGRESCSPCLQWSAKWAAFPLGRNEPTATGRWFELRFQTSSRQGDQEPSKTVIQIETANAGRRRSLLDHDAGHHAS